MLSSLPNQCAVVDGRRCKGKVLQLRIKQVRLTIHPLSVKVEMDILMRRNCRRNPLLMLLLMVVLVLLRVVVGVMVSPFGASVLWRRLNCHSAVDATIADPSSVL